MIHMHRKRRRNEGKEEVERILRIKKNGLDKREEKVMKLRVFQGELKLI